MREPATPDPHLVKHFLDNMTDLYLCATSTDAYLIQKAAPPIRILILDSSPLVHRITKYINMKISYTVNGQLSIRKKVGDRLPFGGTTINSVKPIEGIPQFRAASLQKDEFLKVIVGAVNHIPITVKDLYNHYAFIYGTIHSHPASDELDVELLELRKAIEIGELPGAIFSFRSIAEVIHDALVPLRDEVISRYTNNGHILI